VLAQLAAPAVSMLDPTSLQTAATIDDARELYRRLLVPTSALILPPGVRR